MSGLGVSSAFAITPVGHTEDIDRGATDAGFAEAHSGIQFGLPEDVGRQPKGLRGLAQQPPGGTPVYPKWRPEDRYIVSSDSDKVVQYGAMAKAIDRHVPNQNHFHFYAANASSAGPSRHFGTTLNSTSLSPLTLADRLDLHGHGDSERFEGLSAAQLAVGLRDAGLSEVGVLKLQACEAGQGSFLEDLAAELNRLGIRVGYVSGPIANISDTRIPVSIFGRQFNIQYLPKVVFYSGLKSKPRPEKFALKTVRGNSVVAFPGTRYK
jgi:hypothetical protein